MKTISLDPRFVIVICVVLALPIFVAAGCSGPSTSPGAATAVADEALWCDEHGVEEKYCVLCHPEIRDSDLLLCPEHGNIPEEICTACHPELKEKYETCPHELPTAFCPQCSPEFAAFLEGGAAATEHEHDHENEG